MSESGANDNHQITLGMEEILQINQQIKGVLSDLHTKQTTLSSIYGDLVKENQSKLYLFGLDSLQFQSQMIRVEHTNLEKFHKIISPFTNVFQFIRNSSYVKKTL